MSSHVLFFIVFLALVLLSATTAWSAFSCYDESSYPSIVRLENTEEGIRVTLGTRFLANGKLPVLSYSPTSGWQSAPGCTYPGFAGGTVCFSSIPTYDQLMFPTFQPSRKQASALGLTIQKIRQSIGPSVQVGKYFFATVLLTSKEESEMEEGDTWVHTIGRYIPITGQFEVRRPTVLTDSWITSVAHDGHYLWFGTAGHCPEGDTFPPAHGLIRYDWGSDRIMTFEGKEDGPCGFVIHDLSWSQEILWVATDLGLSRLDKRSHTWKHFVPDVSSKALMHPTTCRNLYDHLLKTVPRSLDLVTGTSPHAQLVRALKRFKPQFDNPVTRDYTPAN